MGKYDHCPSDMAQPKNYKCWFLWICSFNPPRRLSQICPCNALYIKHLRSIILFHSRTWIGSYNKLFFFCRSSVFKAIHKPMQIWYKIENKLPMRYLQYNSQRPANDEVSSLERGKFSTQYKNIFMEGINQENSFIKQYSSNLQK